MRRILFAAAAGLMALLLLAGCQSTKPEGSGNAENGSAQVVAEAKQDSLRSYRMEDIRKLKRTEIFAEGAVEHIFDGSINKSGKATGYHYDGVEDSKGKIVEGTRSPADQNGIFTAKVEVSGVKKNGFSSFYPEEWSPQQVVDTINEAYQDALRDKSNPHGDLWIGYAGELEINMYLTKGKKIITAYPVRRKD